MIPFEEFRHIVRTAEAKGTIRINKPLSDFDLAVMWAVAFIGETKGGYPCDISVEEIWNALPEFKVVEEEEGATQ